LGKRLKYRIQHQDGSWRVLESVASTIRDAKGEMAKLVIVNRDMTERMRLHGSGEIPGDATRWSWPISIISKSSTRPWERLRAITS
jgi:hypothetical protein